MKLISALDVNKEGNGREINTICVMNSQEHKRASLNYIILLLDMSVLYLCVLSNPCNLDKGAFYCFIIRKGMVCLRLNFCLKLLWELNNIYNITDVKNHHRAGKEAIIGEVTIRNKGNPLRSSSFYKAFGIPKCHCQQRAETSVVSLGWECCSLDVCVLPRSHMEALTP